MIRRSWTFRRVSRRQPCPVCGKPDFCRFAEAVNLDTGESRQFAACMRVEAGAEWVRMGEHGIEAYHRLGGEIVERVATLPKQERAATLDAPKWHAIARDQITPARRHALARSLGLMPEVLDEFGLGWLESDQLRELRSHVDGDGCFTFPMTRGDGKVCGLRTRYESGQKRSIAGSRAGVFERSGLPFERPVVWAPEGPTDAAALVLCGYEAVGRHAACGSHDEIARYVGPERECVIVIDRDALKSEDEQVKAGYVGAIRLASAIIGRVGGVKLLTVPGGYKDARQMVQSMGARSAKVRLDVAYQRHRTETPDRLQHAICRVSEQRTGAA